MRLSISTIHGNVTPDMKEYAERKVTKIRKFFAKGMLDAEVHLSTGDPWSRAETIVHVKNQGSIIAKSKADDLYKAIDGMVEKLERQVKALKEKVSTNRKRASQRAQAVRNNTTLEQSISGE